MSSDLTILSVVNSNPMAKTSIRNEVEKLTDFHRELVFKHFPANSVKMESSPGRGTLYQCRPGGELQIQSQIENGDPVERICRSAEEINADLVIVGNRGSETLGRLC